MAVFVALVLATIPGPAQAGPAQAGPPTDARAPDEPGIELVDRPAWTRPTDSLSFLIATTGAVSTMTVQIEVFSRLDSVAELAESATQDTGVRLSLSPRVPVGFLGQGPDGTRVVGLEVAPEPVDGLTTQLVAPGVHPVVISLVDDASRVVDEIRTPLVRLGDEDDPWEAPELAVLLDVAAPPSLQPDGTREIDASQLERLARVGEVLTAHPGLDLTVAAVPDTIEALAALADPAATTLLDRIVGRDVLAQTYLPVGVESLLDADLEGLLPELLARGEAVLADRLSSAPRPGVWDPSAAISPAGFEVLESLDLAWLLVPSPTEDDPSSDDDADEPSALADSGPRPIEDADELLGAVIDPVLSTELARPVGSDADAAHVQLARLLLRPVEPDPGNSETDDGETDDEVVADTTTVLVRPGPLAADSVLAGLLGLLDAPDSPIRVGGLQLVDPVADRDAEPIEWEGDDPVELGPIGARARAAIDALGTYEALVAAESARSDDLRLQVITAVAATTPTPDRLAAIELVEKALGDTFTGIRLSGQTDLNLTSRQGTLPVTVENTNPFPIDVQVRIRSDRLAFPSGEVIGVTVEADDLVRIDVPVEALATGSVPVFVELWTTDDRLRLDARQLNVRSTAVSGVGLVLSVGALVVLVVWWARSWRRTRAARGEGAQGSDPGTARMG